MERLLFTAEEAAEVLGLGRTKVYELMASGRLLSVTIGTCRRVPADALRSYVDSLRAVV